MSAPMSVALRTHRLSPPLDFVARLGHHRRGAVRVGDAVAAVRRLRGQLALLDPGAHGGVCRLRARRAHLARADRAPVRRDRPQAGAARLAGGAAAGDRSLHRRHVGDLAVRGARAAGARDRRRARRGRGGDARPAPARRRRAGRARQRCRLGARDRAGGGGLVRARPGGSRPACDALPAGARAVLDRARRHAGAARAGGSHRAPSAAAAAPARCRARSGPRSRSPVSA